MNLFKTSVWSITLYGSETWTIEATEKKIDAFEIWCCRRELKVSWVDRVRNIEQQRKT